MCAHFCVPCAWGQWGVLPPKPPHATSAGAVGRDGLRSRTGVSWPDAVPGSFRFQCRCCGLGGSGFPRRLQKGGEGTGRWGNRSLWNRRCGETGAVGSRGRFTVLEASHSPAWGLLPGVALTCRPMARVVGGNGGWNISNASPFDHPNGAVTRDEGSEMPSFAGRKRRAGEGNPCKAVFLRAQGWWVFWEAQGLSLLSEWFLPGNVKVAAPQGQPCVLRSSPHSPLSERLQYTQEHRRKNHFMKERKKKGKIPQSFPAWGIKYRHCSCYLDLWRFIAFSIKLQLQESCGYKNHSFVRNQVSSHEDGGKILILRAQSAKQMNSYLLLGLIFRLFSSVSKVLIRIFCEIFPFHERFSRFNSLCLIWMGRNLCLRTSPDFSPQYVMFAYVK